MAIDSFVSLFSSRVRSKRAPLALLAAAALVSGCDRSDPSPGGPNGGSSAADVDSEVAVRWLDTVYAALRTEALSPPVASRVIGYAGVAFYEAVVRGIPGGQSLGGQLNGLGALPEPSDEDIDWASAANSASATVLGGLLPTASMATSDAISALETEIADQRRDDVGDELADRSEDFGRDIGEAILAWAAADGLTQWNNCAYTPPMGPGLWVPTPPMFAPPLQPCWGELRTFALLAATDCPALPHPTYSEVEGSDFCNEVVEVYDTVNALSAEQLEIAQFWADAPGMTGTPPGHWASILAQVCEQQQLDLAVAAEGFARVGIAVADAFIACWETKYVDNLLRPITYIRAPTCPINDEDWVTAPQVGTPPFPEFTSGHSVQSGAAAFVLQDLLGDVSFVDDTHAASGKPARSFATFDEAAEEAAISRLYGGIHFRSAIENGLEQGRCIAATILADVHFR